MLKGRKVGLASEETRLKEIEYINKFSNYTNEQKMVLFGILDEFEKVINKIQEINFNSKLNSNEKQALLSKIDERYNYLEALYKTTKEEFDNQIGPKKR